MSDTLAHIPVAACRASPTARPIMAVKVAELARSIAEVGLRQPISVRPLADGLYEVRGGGHRLAAFASLGRDTIPAFIRADDDLHAELAEIDENLVRNELGPAERAIAIARRKVIYEALHPEAAHGGDRKSSRQVGDLIGAERFTRATSEATGTSERSIQRDARRGQEIGEAQLRAVVGTSLDKGEELDALARLPEERRQSIIDRAGSGEKVSAKIEAKKDRRETREAELGQRQRALPTKKYGVILADPEWRFDVRSRETGLDRAADNHYPTSDLAAIKARPVAGIAADDCVLFLWATAPMLPQALEVMAAWGFVYKSHLVWRKAEKYQARPVLGTGYWFRNGHEILLVGARGRVVAPAMGTQWASIADAPPLKHSAKPDWQYELIEAYFPSLPKIELNARRARPGWDAWGLEAPEPEAPGNHAGGMISADNGPSFARPRKEAPGSELPPHDPETGEIIESEDARSPSNRDASAGGKPWQDGAPRGHRPFANEDAAILAERAGHEGHSEGGAGNGAATISAEADHGLTSGEKPPAEGAAPALTPVSAGAAPPSSETAGRSQASVTAIEGGRHVERTASALRAQIIERSAAGKGTLGPGDPAGTVIPKPAEIPAFAEDGPERPDHAPPPDDGLDIPDFLKLGHVACSAWRERSAVPDAAGSAAS